MAARIGSGSHRRHISLSRIKTAEAARRWGSHTRLPHRRSQNLLNDVRVESTSLPGVFSSISNAHLYCALLSASPPNVLVGDG
jgi:hypothetical protein